MSAYITSVQFDAAFGEQERIDLTGDDPTVFDRAAGDASSLIDGYLGTRYTLPLANVPQMVVGWALDITRYRLWDNRAPDQVQKRNDDAIAALGQLAKGLIVLPPGSDGAPAATDYPTASFSAPRIFDSSQLGDFANDQPRVALGSDPFRWPTA